MIIASLSCEKEKVIENEPLTEVEKSEIDSGMPGKYLVDMQFDADNNYYFVTFRFDETTWDSALYYYKSRYYLSRKTDEIGEFEILDSNFVRVDKIVFDKNNNLWGINYKTLFLRKNNTCDTIIKLGFDGIFTHLAVDGDNNIWVGGGMTGLYKVDPDLNITKYTTANSNLTSNSMESIHVDESNNIWVALYMPYRVLKITGNNWTVYNSPGTTDQTIWSLVTDYNANLWIGKGWDDESEMLVRFNGDVWETIYPMNDKGELVLGVVRLLISDTKKLFVVIESNVNRYEQLLTFDGTNWNLISGFPKPTPTASYIRELIIDYSRQVLWIRSNTGIYKLDL